MRALKVLLAVLVSMPATAEVVARKFGESPKNMAAELRLGSYLPNIDKPLQTVDSSGKVITPGPYEKSFGSSGMLLFEAEIDRQLYTGFGSFGIALLGGYAEKYGHAVDASGATTSETTSLQLVPLKLLAVYRFDELNTRWRIPLVPYVKGGFALDHWWASKGKSAEVSQGLTGIGWSYGLAGMVGMMFLLDILDPRLARDFDNSVGVNHSYLFAEFNFSWINDFGRKTSNGAPWAVDLSSVYGMFGLAFEY